MKKTFAMVAAAAAFSLGTSLAVAQGVTIDLTPEVRTHFHEHVVTEKISPVEVETELAVGAMVPAEVSLHPVPPTIVETTPELEGHQFFVVGERIHVVHPETRAIVTVID